MYKRKSKTEKNEVNVNNRFDILNEESCNFFMISEEQEENRKKNQNLRQSVPKMRFEEINTTRLETGAKKINSNDLKPTDTKNRFKIFEDNSGESVDQIVERKFRIS